MIIHPVVSFNITWIQYSYFYLLTEFVYVTVFAPAAPFASLKWLKGCSGPSRVILESFTWTDCQTYWRVSGLHTPSAPLSSLQWGSASAPPHDQWWGWYWNKQDGSCVMHVSQQIPTSPATEIKHSRPRTRVLQICIPLCQSPRLRSIESLLSLLPEDLGPPGVLLHFHIQCTSTGCPLQEETTALGKVRLAD